MMKKKLLYIVFAIIASVSCSKEPANLTIAQGQESESVVDYKGGETLFSFTSESKWYAESDKYWLELKPDHGSSGNVTIRATAPANGSKEPRVAVVTIYSGGKSLTWNVKIGIPPRLEFLQGQSSKEEVDSDGGIFTVKYFSSDSWSAKADQTWVTINKDKGEYGNNELELQVSSNELKEERSAVVTIISGELSLQYSISQKANNPPFVLPALAPNFKSIALLGSRFLSYGGFIIPNLVFDNAQGEITGGGIFQKLCELNGKQIKVYASVHKDHSLADLGTDGCKEADSKHAGGGCPGAGSDLLTGIPSDVDVVLFSDSGSSRSSDAESANIMVSKSRFTNPNLVAISAIPYYHYSKNFTGYYNDLAVASLKNIGVNLCGYGSLMYDIVKNVVVIKGSNIDYTSLGTKGAGVFNNCATSTMYPNPLAAYIASVWIYCRLTGAKAEGQPYDFVKTIINFDEWLSANNAYPAPSNTFIDVFNSPNDMLEIQKLIDQYLETEYKR